MPDDAGLIPMVGPDGSRKMIPSAQVSLFEKAGARRATPEEVQARRSGGMAQDISQMRFNGLPTGQVPQDVARDMLMEIYRQRIANQQIQGRQQLESQKETATQGRTTVPVNDQLLKNYPKIAKMGYAAGDHIPQAVFDSLSGEKGASLGLRDTQFWEKQWVDTGKDMDISKASSRTPLGVAVTNNQKSYRAYKLLNSKGTFTPEDKRLVTTDLAAMMKGGVPDKESEAGQAYGSLLENFTNLAREVTAKPQNLDVPEIRDHLREVMKGIVEVDNRVIRDHVDAVESSRSDVIAKRPKDWEKLKAKALKHVVEDESGKKGDDLDDLIDKHMNPGGR